MPMSRDQVMIDSLGKTSHMEKGDRIIKALMRYLDRVQGGSDYNSDWMDDVGTGDEEESL